MTPEQKFAKQRADRLIAIEAQVNDLISRGLKRRAATLCLSLIDAADTAADRQRFASLRSSLFRSSRMRDREQSWHLAGQFLGDL